MTSPYMTKNNSTPTHPAQLHADPSPIGWPTSNAAPAWLGPRERRNVMDADHQHRTG